MSVINLKTATVLMMRNYCHVLLHDTEAHYLLNLVYSATFTHKTHPGNRNNL